MGGWDIPHSCFLLLTLKQTFKKPDILVSKTVLRPGLVTQWSHVPHLFHKTLLTLITPIKLITITCTPLSSVILEHIDHVDYANHMHNFFLLKPNYIDWMITQITPMTYNFFSPKSQSCQSYQSNVPSPVSINAYYTKNINYRGLVRTYNSLDALASLDFKLSLSELVSH